MECRAQDGDFCHGKCVALLGAGDDCSAGKGFCGQGLACGSGPTPTCEATVGEGQPCLMRSCAVGSFVCQVD